MDALKYLSLLSLAGMLAGCGNYARTPPQLEDDLTRRFIDKPANEFFEMYGPPAGDFVNDDGSTVYRWASLPVPAEPIATEYRVANGTYDIVDTYNGKPQAYYCELRIYADPANVIRDVRVAVDSTGRWSSSRCTEVF